MCENILFYLFGGIALISAITVITTKNPVHSVLFLILAFISSAGLLFLLEIEFISLIFIVVYVGAIAVLFLFVVMMLDIKISDSNSFFFKYFPIGSFLGFAFLVELLLTVTEILKSNTYIWNQSSQWLPEINNKIFTNSLESTVLEKVWVKKLVFVTNIDAIGQVLYTYYFMYFLISGILLLVAMIGAIVLTLSFTKKSKVQSIPRQVSRQFTNAIFFVKSRLD